MQDAGYVPVQKHCNNSNGSHSLRDNLEGDVKDICHRIGVALKNVNDRLFSASAHMTMHVCCTCYTRHQKAWLARYFQTWQKGLLQEPLVV